MYPMTQTPTTYRSQSARDAAASGYGSPSYATYLDRSAQEHADYYTARGEHELAVAQFTRSLSNALRGNEGE